MIVDSIHFDGANTTSSQDKVGLVMTFVVASATADYKQPRAFCKPQPPEVFHKAFTSVFLDLGSALNQSVIQVVRGDSKPSRGGSSNGDSSPSGTGP